ncbi:MAG TPA: hypothetical protein PKI11_18500 [Candidatus Hydrogenedentes bacterium]|nr:hypothetical protein [Candidatus Hydrogenedentota bacterium]
MNKAVAVLCVLVAGAAVGGGVYYYVTVMSAPDLGPAPKPIKADEDAPPPEPQLPPASPLVSHETVATPNTDARLVVSPRKAADFLHALVPWDMLQKSDLPVNIKVLLEKHLAEIMPNEIALLGGPDFAAKTYGFTFFVNQQYFDVLLPAGTGLLGLPGRVPLVAWSEDGFQLREPGVLTANGTLPIPEGLEGKLQELWETLDAAASPLTVGGDHLIELALDNRRGELLSLYAVAASQSGQTVEDLFANPMFRSVPQVLAQLSHVRACADLGPAEELTVDVAVQAAESAGPEIEPFIAFAVDAILPELKGTLAQFGLTLEGKAQWEGKTYHGAFAVPEFGDVIRGLVAAQLAEAQEGRRGKSDS